MSTFKTNVNVALKEKLRILKKNLSRLFSHITFCLWQKIGLITETQIIIQSPEIKKKKSAKLKHNILDFLNILEELQLSTSK